MYSAMLLGMKGYREVTTSPGGTEVFEAGPILTILDPGFSGQEWLVSGSTSKLHVSLRGKKKSFNL